MQWRFKFYRSEDGESQPKAWYEEQLRAVQAAFDGELFRLALKKDLPESRSWRVPGYSEVLEIALELEWRDGAMKVSAIGYWQTDSPNFVILLCCEETNGDYDPPLYQALELRKACDNHKGRIYEHIPADEPND